MLHHVGAVVADIWSPRMSRRRPFPFFLLLCSTLGGPLPLAPAEETRWTTTVTGERDGAATAARLQAARDLEAKNDWDAAVDEYTSILADAGDDLVPLSNGHYLQARLVCQNRIAALPPEALALYRKRADIPAKKLYEAGAAERDPRVLRRVVDEAFCSRPAESALDLLGEIAFEQGRPEVAEHWWRMLAVPASQEGNSGKPPAGLDLLYPDPQGDKARYRAKQLLARVFRGDPSMTLELKAFRALHPKSEGLLAGRKGNFGEILRSLAEQPDLKEPPRPEDVWPTVAGDFSRSRVLPSPPDRNWLSRLCEDEPIQFDLAKRKLIKPDNTAPPEALAKGNPPRLSDARALAFYPVLFDHKVAVADAYGVTIYDPLSGEVHDWSPKHGALGQARQEPKLPARADLRWTLTVNGRRLYARLGAESFDPAKKQKQEPSSLVCLEWLPEKKKLDFCWRVSAHELDKEQTAFEGSPVVADGRVYIALTRLDDKASTFIACLDAVTGAVRWRQDLCECSSVDAKHPRFRHHLLTLAGSSIIYATHTGVIAALDADTGKRLWAVRYPSRGLMIDATTPSPRDLTPCVYAAGRVFVAPADSNHLFCLDVGTGRTLWVRDQLEIVHLLGVAEGKLLFDTIKGRMKLVRAVQVSDGVDEWNTELAPFGRGLIVGDMVLYPTPKGVRVLNVSDGQSAIDRLNIPNGRLEKLSGNLAYAGGVLAVTDQKHLTTYVAPSLSREQRHRDVREKPDSATAHYRLAVAETDTCNLEAALQEWKRVEETDSSKVAGLLRGKAQEQRHDLLLRAGKQALAKRAWENASDHFTEAARPEFPEELRVRALAFEAALWQELGNPARAAVAYDAIARDEAFRSKTVLDEKSNPQVAGIWAASRFDDLIRAYGPRVFAAMGDVTPQPPRTRRLTPQEREDALFRRPQGYWTRQSPDRVATRCERDGKVGLASAAWRACLRHGVQDPLRPNAQVQLARLYEQECCWPAAWHVWEDIAREDQTPGPAGIIWRALAAEQVRRIAGRALRERVLRPSREGPWRRSGETELGAREFLLPVDETTGMGARADLFFVDGNELICRAEDTGKPRWQRTLPWQATWIGFQDDWLLAGGPRGVQALTADAGDSLWEYPAPRSMGQSGAARDADTALSAFRMSEGKLYFLQGERRFFALDAATGLVLWTQWAPDARLGLPSPRGRFFPKYQANGERVGLQTASGRWWLLDAADGRLIFAGPTVAEPWLQAPLALDRDHWCLTIDCKRVVLLDPATGKTHWTHEIPGSTTADGVLPLVFGNGESLTLLIGRNFGCCLQRIDPRTGKKVWEQERLVSNGPIALEAAAEGDEATYLIADNVLSAYALKDGRFLWERVLSGPKGNWRLALHQSQLIVYPLEPAGLEFHLRGPFGWLECTCASFDVDQSEQGFPVILADPDSGRLDQRLNFTAPSARVRLTARFNLFAAAEPEIGLRMTTPLPSVPVRFTGAAAAVALPGRLWILMADKPSRSAAP
jgi:outer membrane protein assembly factor BamB